MHETNVIYSVQYIDLCGKYYQLKFKIVDFESLAEEANALIKMKILIFLISLLFTYKEMHTFMRFQVLVMGTSRYRFSNIFHLK